MNNFQRTSGFGGYPGFPPVLKALLIINVSVYFFQLFFLNNFTIAGISLESIFSLQPLSSPVQGHGFWSFMPWQLISYQFLHDTHGFSHLLFNMFALWMFGSELEHLWGSRKFLIYYLLCGIGAGLAQLFIAPMFSPPAPVIGASGSIYGILLAFGLTFPKRPILMLPFFIPLPALVHVTIFTLLELWTGLSGSDGIAHFAHLGGALTGILLIKFADNLGLYEKLNKLFSSSRASVHQKQSVHQPAKIFQVDWQFKSQQKEPPNEPSKYTGSTFDIDGEDITQAKVDLILDKISSSGYQNLSEREKRILFELSKKIK
ncbi:MAG: hypothetical protein HW421_2591 [Ignavibacteria bacterium]|nr:hypothetical protein [Ignavibacteria bacterium]